MGQVAASAAVDGVWLGVAVTARTPASSANLGPGFDSLGLALALYDEVTVVAAAPGSSRSGDVEVSVVGEGAGVVPLGEDHLVVRSLRAGLSHARVGQPALRLQCRNSIPHGRGLGSSAAAIAVGLVLAQRLLVDPDRLDDQAVYDLVATAEGHPDNASAALFGGFTIAWFDDDANGRTEPGPRRAGVVRLPVDPRVRAVVCVPDVELATSRARAMLPVTVPHADAAFNAGRSALLVQALTARPDLLLVATDDRLHQAQRAPAMPESAALLAEVRRRGVAAVISGAGPSVLVLGDGGDPATMVAEVLAGGALGAWRVHPLAVDLLGTRLLEPQGRPERGSGVESGLGSGVGSGVESGVGSGLESGAERADDLATAEVGQVAPTQG